MGSWPANRLNKGRVAGVHSARTGLSRDGILPLILVQNTPAQMEISPIKVIVSRERVLVLGRGKPRQGQHRTPHRTCKAKSPPPCALSPVWGLSGTAPGKLQTKHTAGVRFVLKGKCYKTKQRTSQAKFSLGIPTVPGPQVFLVDLWPVRLVLGNTNQSNILTGGLGL